MRTGAAIFPNAIRKAHLFFLISVLCFCGAFAASDAAQTNQKQSTSLLDEGIKLLSNGHFLEAVATFNRMKQTAPNDPHPYFYSGIALTEAGKLSAAALELSEAVRLDPRRPEFLIFQANVFVHLKQRTHAIDALAIFDKEGAAKQVDEAWLWLLADVYFRLEKTDDALRILGILAARNPGDSRVDLKRGQIYLAKGEIDLAEEAIRNSIKRSPQDAVAQFELGKILHQRNEIAASKKALLVAIRQDPNNPEYLHRLGLVCLALNEIDEAIVYLERAEPSGSSFPQIYYALGSAFQRKGDRDKAWKYRKKYQEVSLALRTKEDRDREVGKLIKEGEKQLDLGNRAEARTLFERVLQIDPGDWDAHGYLAEILLSSPDWRLSYEHLIKMEEIDPESAVGNYLIAKYWYQGRAFEKARTYAEKVKFVRPGHAEVRNLLGHIYVGLGEEEKALREYEAAVQLAPDRSDFRENLTQFKNRSPQKGSPPKPL